MVLKLKAAIENGTIDNKDNYLKCFEKIFNKFSIIKESRVRGNWIYIASSLRKKILNAAHEGNQGIAITKKLLKAY